MALEMTFPSTGAALVFGGSGGVGSAICKTLAKAGCPIAFTYFRGEDRAKALGAELDAKGVANSMHALDTKNPEAVQTLVDHVAEKYQGIHTVVTASGSYLQFRTISEVDVNRWRENVDTDVNGIFYIVKAVIPHLRKSSGSLVALSTMAFHRILPRDAVSACPKAAVETLIRQLACEEGANGVRANTVALGAINAGQGAVDSGSSIIKDMGEEAVGAIIASIRLGGRMGTAQEVANTVAFLASSEASYITGQTLLVDGGSTL